MGIEIATQLAEFTTQTSYETVPKEVLEFTKGLILKTVAGTVAGSATPSGQRMARFIRDRKLPEEVAIIGSGFKTSLWEATFLHGFFAHARELEDNRYGSGQSWNISVIPPLISLADKLKLSGKALLEAVVVGLEVHVRTCSFPTQHLELLIVPGSVGPAAGVAKALGLSTQKTLSAMGLAMCAVTGSHANSPTDAHFLESSLQCLQGLMGAELAKEGMTGNPDLVFYLSNLLGKDKVVNPGIMVEGLGKKWLLCDFSIKKYPVCGRAQRQIDSLIELMKGNNLSYEQIEVVEVHAPPGFERRLDRPEPTVLQDLLFSFQHSLGAAMLDGDVTLEHVSEAALTDPRLRDARSKVKVIFHSDWPPVHWTEYPGRITVRTKDGREFRKERRHVIGSPEEPMKTEQIRELYPKFTRGLLPERLVSRTAEAILNMERLDDIRELMDSLAFRR